MMLNEEALSGGEISNSLLALTKVKSGDSDLIDSNRLTPSFSAIYLLCLASHVLRLEILKD